MVTTSSLKHRLIITGPAIFVWPHTCSAQAPSTAAAMLCRRRRRRIMINSAREAATLYSRLIFYSCDRSHGNADWSRLILAAVGATPTPTLTQMEFSFSICHLHTALWVTLYIQQSTLYTFGPIILCRSRAPSSIDLKYCSLYVICFRYILMGYTSHAEHKAKLTHLNVNKWFTGTYPGVCGTYAWVCVYVWVCVAPNPPNTDQKPTRPSTDGHSSTRTTFFFLPDANFSRRSIISLHNHLLTSFPEPIKRMFLRAASPSPPLSARVNRQTRSWITVFL